MVVHPSVIVGLFAAKACHLACFEAIDHSDRRKYRWDIVRWEGDTVFYTRQWQPGIIRSTIVRDENGEG